MALPSNRTEFLEYCMRKLGKGAIDINVTSHQAQDRIDEAIEQGFVNKDSLSTGINF